MIRYIAPLLLLVAAGCGILPEVTHKPVIRNPFPQLHRVAVLPFINLSDEPTVDGRQFSIAYFNELQAIPGFEVIPLAVVEQEIRRNELTFNDSGEDARRLAQILDVDAVVVGAITEYSPYYPPRCGLHVEWWTANPGFHPIPPGYGLPWGTVEEEFIPEPLVYEAEFALAREQLKTQTPEFERATSVEAPGWRPPSAPRMLSPNQEDASELLPEPSGDSGDIATPPIPTDIEAPGGATDATDTIEPTSADLPADWPDERGFFPQPPHASRPASRPSREPVLTHTRVYHGNDADFAEALSTYAYFRDDARYGGWRAYLKRSDDFIRFCCHLHIAEMLSARGGASETQVVWRWSDVR
ncbi:MAG: hypothetical protein KDA42_14530 [Planctomycetales bacterium]|nr:hypothetical protein [Planctomycetales bacterium]